MINIHTLSFNPFQENTFILWDETSEAVIIDPGCSNPYEEETLVHFIESKGLKPVLLLNTHAHIDHILGNHFIANKFNLELHLHEKDLPALKAGEVVAQQYGIPYTPSPDAKHFLEEGQSIKFGASQLEVVFTPGHSPGSVCFISHPDKMVIGGDVLFYNSIGRTDLPGGNHQQLMDSIHTKLYSLPDDYAVYPGHGPATSIGFEKQTNPFTT